MTYVNRQAAVPFLFCDHGLIPPTEYTVNKSELQGLSSNTMEFTLTPVLPSDAPAITDIFFASFTNALSQRMSPDTEDVRAFETAFFKNAAEEAQSSKGSDFIKVVASEPGQEGQDAVIAGFALWKYYEGEKDPHEGEKIEWPPSSDSALCESFFTGVDQERKMAIGDQPHYCVFSYFISLW